MVGSVGRGVCLKLRGAEPTHQLLPQLGSAGCHYLTACLPCREEAVFAVEAAPPVRPCASSLTWWWPDKPLALTAEGGRQNWL